MTGPAFKADEAAVVHAPRPHHLINREVVAVPTRHRLDALALEITQELLVKRSDGVFTRELTP
jgi:hypothetical protein